MFIRLQGFNGGGSSVHREDAPRSNLFSLKPKVAPKPNITRVTNMKQHQPTVDSNDSELMQRLERQRRSLAQY